MSGLDLEALAAFRAGRLGAPGDAAPADQVTALVRQPRPPAPPIESAPRPTPNTSALLAWPGRFPGRPRLNTRILGLLDRVGVQWTVVAARRELRVQGAMPVDPAGHPTPATDEATLPALTSETKVFLAAGDAATAGRIAAAAAAGLLGRVAPRVAHLPGLHDLGRLAGEAKRGLRAALDGR